MKLCSACLLGIKCRYDGKSKPDKKIIGLSRKEALIPVCPEQLGGLETPRPAVQLQNCSGEDVLDGKGTIATQDNKDMSLYFINGAKETLRIAKLFNIKQAIMKQRSPSCGCGQVHDGSFTGKTIKGNGITTALLLRNDIKVITEEDL